MKYHFSNIIGCFIVNEQLEIVDSILFKDSQKEQNYKIKEELQKKHQSLPLPSEKLPSILAHFKDPKFFQDFYQRNLILTKQAIKESVSADQLIIQAIANINEIDKVANILSKRVREWYELYLPEISKAVESHEKFIELITSHTKEEIMQQSHLPTTMGADLNQQHVTEILHLAKEVENLYSLRKKHEQYLETAMKQHCPNLLELAGVTIGARLIELGKGIKHLAVLPASTIQLLGAEKALFRHIKTGSRSPKHGIILQHPLLQRAPRANRGKAARALADKLSLCARLDYFKGEFKAPEYRKELEEKFA